MCVALVADGGEVGVVVGAALADGDDVVDFGGWLVALVAGVVVAFEDGVA